MLDLPSLGLVDLVVLATVVLVVIGAMRRGRGVLSVLGSALGALVLAWVVVVALTARGPAELAGEVQQSAFARTFPMPTNAVQDLDRLTDDGPSGNDGPGGSDAPGGPQSR